MPSRPRGHDDRGDHHGFIPSTEEGLLRARVKAELRKRMRGLRNALPAAACAARSGRVIERLLALDAVARAGAVGLFWPMEGRHEIDLRPLDAALRARGVRVAYPAVSPGTREMALRFVARTDAMAPGPLGVLEPTAADPEAGPGDLDVIVVPALAVDPRGHRIGYGAGFYDRALPRFAPRAAAVAVAFDFQLVAEVPESPVDVPAAWIVTDARSMAAE